MPTLSAKIERDYLSAFKSKDEFRTSVLRLLKSALKNAEIEKKALLNDDDVGKIIKREIKQRRDSIPQYQQGGRADLAEKELREISVLEYYQPAQINDSEIESIIKDTLLKLGVNHKKDYGRAMGVLMSKFQGRADGSKVSQVLNSLLKDD